MKALKTLKTGQDWFDALIPQGIPVPGSIMLSGPGGSGKPLIGNVIAASWLRSGGSVIFMSLQYPDHRFIKAALKSVANLELDEYDEKIAFIELDASLSGISKISRNWIKANMVLPPVWDQAIKQMSEVVPNDGPGILIFASAINLLLFSPTYGEAILEKMKSAVQGDKRYTYLFSASTTAKEEKIAELEVLADHLIMTRGEKQPFRLYMKIDRIKGAKFFRDEIQVPFSEEQLMNTKEIAEHSRKKVIPLISRL